MEVLNKKAAIRKHLRQCTAQVKITLGHYGIFSASIRIVNPGQYDETFLTVRCQANDLLHPENKDTKYSHTRSTKQIRSFPAVGGFYATKVDCEERFDGRNDTASDAKRARALFDLALEVISERNLNYVFPDCELSQFLSALEQLGVVLDGITVDGQEFSDWYRSRSKEVQKAEEAQKAAPETA